MFPNLKQNIHYVAMKRNEKRRENLHYKHIRPLDQRDLTVAS